MQRYHATGAIVNARPLTDEDRAANGINQGDPRYNHVGIFNPRNGSLQNTMDQETFDAHYSPLDLSDTGAMQAGTPMQGNQGGQAAPQNNQGGQAQGNQGATGQGQAQGNQAPQNNNPQNHAAQSGQA